ncbi:hypothetical protein [Corynebacterium ulceribovis]|uniref:hypothetical protein n=1 Tax=Corynebacterium ulceribovis TaxID=487732 RepID=UPI00037E3526|nr:hypothetical protein [Corynebacterium ulceribovis]
MNFDMINVWLNDLSNWGKIFGGAAKLIGNNGALSVAWDFIDGGDFSTVGELLSDSVSSRLS